MQYQKYKNLPFAQMELIVNTTWCNIEIVQHLIVLYRNSAASKNATSDSTISHRATLTQCNMKMCNIKWFSIKQFNVKVVQHRIVQQQNSAT